MTILNMVSYSSWWSNIWEPTNLSVAISRTTATIKWTDNDLNAIPPSTFQKSVLVRKVGSAPTSPSDWTVVVTETTKNTYSSSWYADTGLTSWTTYYYRVYSYSSTWWITYGSAVSTTAGWQPWANTVAYYPLTSSTTVNDMSGNNRNLTNSNVSFWTQFGVDCATISGNNTTTQHTADKYLYANITWLPTWANARTFIYWVYNDNASNTGLVETYVFQWQSSSNRMILSASSNENIGYYWISQYGASGAFWAILRQQRCHHCIVYDGSKFTWYVNWVSTWTWTRTINTGSTKFSLWWASENPAWNAFNGSFSNVILEDKARTAEEVSDYYNNTKWNYWL